MHRLSVPAYASPLEMLAAKNGVEVLLTEGNDYRSTPVISHAILSHNRGRKTGLADSIVVTPSHNPPARPTLAFHPVGRFGLPLPALRLVLRGALTGKRDRASQQELGLSGTTPLHGTARGSPKVGWALGDGREHGDDPAWDAAEAEALYDLLEREVVPEFYSRGEDGLPGAWIARMRESMALLTPRFSTNRTVREYTEQHYIPAAATYLERAANDGVIGVDIVNGRRALDQAWTSLCFGETRCTTRGGQHEFEVDVRLGHLQPKAVQVELYANGSMGNPAIRHEMKCLHQINDASGECVYGATVPAIRSPGDYTARVIPNARGTSIPLENARIRWQR